MSIYIVSHYLIAWLCVAIKWLCVAIKGRMLETFTAGAISKLTVCEKVSLLWSYYSPYSLSHLSATLFIQFSQNEEEENSLAEKSSERLIMRLNNAKES